MQKAVIVIDFSVNWSQKSTVTVNQTFVTRLYDEENITL